MVIHLKIIILTPQPSDDNHAPSSINNRIPERLRLFHIEQIKTLWNNEMTVSSRAASMRTPTSKTNDTATQHTTDHNNPQTSNIRTCKPQTVNPINNLNIVMIKSFYTDGYNPRTPPKPKHSYAASNSSPTTIYHLPCNIAKSICHCPTGSRTGIRAESFNSFLNLVKLDNKKFNEDTYHLFDLVYLNPTPESIAPHFTNTYYSAPSRTPKTSKSCGSSVSPL